MRGRMLQRASKGLIILTLLLLATAPVIFAQEGTPVPDSEYYSVETQVFPDGTSIDKVVINGPPEPPPGYEHPTVLDGATAAAVMLTEVPAYDWSYGCSATSAAMIAAYYDRTDYPNMYTGPGGTPAGVMPMDNSEWGYMAGECPLSATHMGYDGLATRGHVDDYWVEYLSPADDPWYVNGWTEHTYADCTGDFMKTNQTTNYGNVDGSTAFYNYTDGTPLTAADMEGAGIDDEDGGYGIKLFYESRGYTVVTMYNQYIQGQGSDPDLGFTYEQYKVEIDAGRPVMIHVEGHTMVGIGYDDSVSDLMYIRDTWDYNTYTMIWGGSYYGMNHYAVTIVQLAPTGLYNSAGTGSWSVGDTWETGTVPSANGSVTVRAGHTVTLSGDAQCYDLAIESGGTLDLAGHDLVVGGAMTNNGTISQTLNVPRDTTTEFLHIQNAAGTEDKYFGVSITPISNRLGETKVAIHGNQPCPGGSSAVLRCFEITPERDRDADVTFYYRDAEENGQDVPFIWHWAGSAWEQETLSGRGSMGAEYNWVQATGVSAYSPFAAANDNPTAVTLVSFEAALDGAAVLVTWETAMEIDNVGFNLYRSEAPDGPYVKLNESLIPSQAPGAPFGAEYSWLDETVEPGVTYYYKLEDVEVGGLSTFHGPISVSQGPNAISLAALDAHGGPLVAVLAAGSILFGVVGLALARRARRRD